MPEMNNMKVGNDVYEVADPKSRGISLTWAQYQALSYEEQHNGTAYYITDRDAIYPVDHELNANSSNAVANDVVTPHILAMENVLGAKNILPIKIDDVKNWRNPGTWTNSTTYVLNGVTFFFATNSGGYITAISTSGTASAATVLWLCIDRNFYKYNGCILTGTPDPDCDIGIVLNQDPWTNYANDKGQGAIIEDAPDASNVGVPITIQANKDTTGLVLTPMIRPAGTDPTYVPYAMTNRELTERTIKLDKGVVYYEVQGTTDNYGQIDVGLNLNRVTGIFVKDPIGAIAVRATSGNTLQIWAVNNSSATADTLKQIRNEFVSLMITALPNSQV